VRQEPSKLSHSYPLVANEYRAPLEHYLDTLEKFIGKKTAQAPERAWERFLSLSFERRQGIADSWIAQANFIQELADQGLSPKDEIEMLKQALGRLKLLLDFSLLPPIESGDIIEVFSPELVQVYCSFSYFSLCNYSIIELSSYPYYELFERAAWVMNQLSKLGTEVLEGKTNWVSFEHIPDYTIQEILSEEKGLFTMREGRAIRAVSALTRENYMITVKKVRAIPTPPSAPVAFI
jgi:hypothetical protein